MSDTFGDKYWTRAKNPDVGRSMEELRDVAYNDQRSARAPSPAANMVAIAGVLIILAVVIAMTIAGT